MMKLTVKGIDGLKRCPTCHHIPLVEVEELDYAVISCDEHGHIAQGHDVEQAVKHWNHYIEFVEGK